MILVPGQKDSAAPGQKDSAGANRHVCASLGMPARDQAHHSYYGRKCACWAFAMRSARHECMHATHSHRRRGRLWLVSPLLTLHYRVLSCGMVTICLCFDGACVGV